MDLVTAARRVAKAQRMLVLTGAGISAESGVPTFRGPGGLWRNFRPEDLATPEAFARDPVLVWEWYDWRRGIVAGCRPNPAHVALVELETRVRGSFLLVTQNVDGLHQRAGSRNVVELHGSIWRARCLGCGKKEELGANPLLRGSSGAPRCGCGELLRPDVVWFGESLPAQAMQQVFAWAGRADVCLVIGTSGVVQPAAAIPPLVKEHGGTVVEVNVEATPLTPFVDIALHGKAGEILPTLVSGV